MKTCTKCLETKPVAGFYLAMGKHRARCKKCVNADNVAHQAANPERASKRVNAWRKANLEMHSSQTKRRRKVKPELFRRNYYWSSYRIEFLEEWERQAGLCAACSGPMVKSGRKPRSVCADHDGACCPGKMSCGRCFRGLIHRNCNLTLGYAKDDPKILRAALRYLERLTCQPPDNP